MILPHNLPKKLNKLPQFTHVAIRNGNISYHNNISLERIKHDMNFYNRPDVIIVSYDDYEKLFLL